jgi:hypothetical protein
MLKKFRQPLPREITFITNVPVCIVAEHVRDGSAYHWRIKRVVVDDENVNLDPDHVQAQDASGNEIPKNNLVVTRAFNAVSESEWPAWELGW